MAPTFVHAALALLSSIESGLDISNSRLVRRQASEPGVSPNLPAGFKSLGCYTDNTNSRSLYQTSTTSNSMTEEYCINYCNNNGYPFSGVEYASECYCGSYIAASSQQANATDCNMACSGDSTELCGGPNRLNVFQNSSYVAASSGPVHNPGVNGFGYLGCFIDSVGNRTMPNGGQVNGAMTVAGCTAACYSEGYTYAGVEYAGECYCSDALPNSFAAPDGLSGCDMVCKGNTSEYCGGPNRLDAYGYGQKSIFAPQWAFEGCVTDSVQSRTFQYGVQVVGGYTNMTISNCQNACLAAGYVLAGTEYGQECWCDNEYENGGGPAPDGNAGCNMACKGNPQSICGGSNRLDVYSYIGNQSTSSVSSSTSTSTATTSTGAFSTMSVPANSTTTAVSTSTSATSLSTSSAIPSSAATDLPGNWAYSGCYIDNAYGRILGDGPSSNDLTVESCISGCSSQGYTIAGMEYSTECYCGNAIVNGGALASSDSDCDMTCGGNNGEMCGGPNRVSIYSSGNFSSYAPPTAKNTSLPGEWQYQGCLSDTPQPRVLPYQINFISNLTISNCLNLCAQYQYSAASMEYGEQCFCGDDTDRIAAGATFLTGDQCNTPCSDEPTALCGGSNAMNYYTWENMYTWNQGEGDSAGLYQMFIGGVVVPLITTVSLSGKVLFTEKYGTSPNPNSTGAFELDPSLASNFTAAWRTLTGLKTDVFCSAGLTLPDRAGRTLNIGGWSDESTYGIRLYWPDGEQGQPSYNEWQENYQEVSLLSGRWYPGAMQMVNGSILVVGGEAGSNGASVPSLEVIPTPAGVTTPVYMDWLQRTDPNNLYPFLCVLPSGGIAAFYYNEARILDENTFETIRSLPNIPGAVNNFLAGRTYPLEGTSMLMPQYYPYTDPLTVLICGGSTPYAGIALDNCVSIQPEVSGQNWTVERMPDQRVMTCIVALPDGTYIIMNGAQQGMAGFGLASDPNLMAVQYDPSQPLNQRMTRMANTTIARLYHSEAILMQDGRILVSGSDPEDNVHPEEYRVEVFTPPYLMGERALTRPDFIFSANNSASRADYDYNTQFSIAVNSSVSKIAFMAAVSSTHGNSMGQRTIFPQFSCGEGGSTQPQPSSNSTGPFRLLHRQSSNSTSNSTNSSSSVSTASYTNICTITTPTNGYISGGPGWHQLFVLDADGTPSNSKWVRIGGDPAALGNWPNFPDFDLPGVGSVYF